jgi:hypothetical protein
VIQVNKLISENSRLKEKILSLEQEIKEKDWELDVLTEADEIVCALEAKLGMLKHLGFDPDDSGAKRILSDDEFREWITEFRDKLRAGLRDFMFGGEA